MFDIDLEMEAGDDGPPDEFPEGASPAALQRILRKLSAGLDDLLSPQGRCQQKARCRSNKRNSECAVLIAQVIRA